MAEGKSTFGLEKNVACAATYVLGWISGLVFFLAEKDDKDVRFNALQSVITFGALTVLGMVPFVGWALAPFFCLLGFVLWLFLLVKTYQGSKIKLPVVGEIAEKQVNK